ncbi:MAG: CAP domain-containing protein [Solirubrobacteraceae bacterium]
MPENALRPLRLAVAAVLALALVPAAPATAATHAKKSAHAARSHRHSANSASACQDTTLIPTQANVGRVAAATLCLVNQQRTSRGLAAFRSDANLARTATQHSLDMVARNYFGHVSPGGSTPLDRIRSSGYLHANQSFSVGENIAVATGSLGTPAGIVQMWMNSPGHRANILNAAFRDTGMGVAPGAPASVGRGAGGTYTQDFGVKG